MMRAPSSYCVAVRKPDGEIVTDRKPLNRISDRHPAFRWPVIRGLVTLGSAMALGMKALRFSADCALGRQVDTNSPDKPKNIVPQLILSLLFAIALYKFVPLYLATFVGRNVAALSSRFSVNLMDGLLRMAIFLCFMYLLSRTRDMYRLFQYHGAEHRVVFNFESGRPVTVENAQSFVTWHPRCGTSFLVVVLFVSLFAYAFLPFDGFWTKFAARILLLPLVVGISYEAIRYGAKHQGGLLALLTRPGLWLQRVTTKPPSNDQTEVAIRALETAMQLEREQGGVLVIA